MSGDGFSDTGMMVFFVTMLVVSGGLVLADVRYCVVRGPAQLPQSAAGCSSVEAVLGSPVLIVATAVAMYI